MCIWVPTLFDIAPVTAYITAANTSKISCFARVSALSLNRIKFLHQGHHKSITHVGATVTLRCGYVLQTI